MGPTSLWREIASQDLRLDPKFPGTGLSDIKKSFEKIAMFKFKDIFRDIF